MKTFHPSFIPMAALLLLVGPLSSFGATPSTNAIRFDLRTFGFDAVAYKSVRIKPSTSSFPRVNNTSIIIADYGFRVSDASGVFTQMMVGSATYTITVTNNFIPTSFDISTPDTNCNCVIDASTLTTAGTNLPSNLTAYTQAASDARFIQIYRGSGTSNIFTRPRFYHGNGPTNGTGTSNYVWTLTNFVTGEGEWRAAASTANAITNNYTGVFHVVDVNGLVIDGFQGDSALISGPGREVNELQSVSTTELGYLDGVTSALQTQLDSKVATNRNNIKLLSPPAGNNEIGDMMTSAADFYGQLGLTWGGTNNYPALWLWASRGTGALGSNVWGSILHVPGGLAQVGQAWNMSPYGVNQKNVHWYLNGAANLADITNSSGDSVYYFHQQSPYLASLASFPATTTNRLQFVGVTATPVGTNTSGRGVYTTDPFGLTVGTIPDGWSAGEANQAGSMVLLLGGAGNTFPFYISPNYQMPGDTVVYQHPYLAIDQRGNSNAVSPLGIGFPIWSANVAHVTNANFKWGFRLDPRDGSNTNNGFATLNSNVLSTARQNGAAIFGGNYGNSAPFIVNGSAQFNSPGTLGQYSNAWTFDGAEANRLGFVLKSGFFPQNAHGALSPWIVSEGGNSDLQANIAGTTFTNQMMISNDVFNVFVPVVINPVRNSSAISLAVLGRFFSDKATLSNTPAILGSTSNGGFQLGPAGSAYSWRLTNIAGSSNLQALLGTTLGFSLLNNGFMGVGTNNPSVRLHIVNDVNTTYRGAGAFMVQEAQFNTAPGIAFQDSTANGGSASLFGIYQGAAYWLLHGGSGNFNGGTEYVFYAKTNAGNTVSVGMGNTAPAGILDIAGTRNSYGLRVMTNDLVVTNGLTGLNTNAPSAGFHYRATAAANPHTRFDDTNGTPRTQFGVYPGAPQFGGIWLGNVTPSGVNYNFLSDGTAFQMNTPSGGRIGFNVADVEVARFSSSGSLLIGTNSAPDSALAVRPGTNQFIFKGFAQDGTVSTVIATNGNQTNSGHIATTAGDISMSAGSLLIVNSGQRVIWASGQSGLGQFGVNTNYFGTAVSSTAANGSLVASNVNLSGNAVFQTTTIAGTGSGNTNYTILTSARHRFLGSSNVNIIAVMGYVATEAHYWNVTITNLSAIAWGVGFSSVTNQWAFNAGGGETNWPTVLTNGMALELEGRSIGTNTWVKYHYTVALKNL